MTTEYSFFFFLFFKRWIWNFMTHTNVILIKIILYSRVHQNCPCSCLHSHFEACYLQACCHRLVFWGLCNVVTIYRIDVISWRIFLFFFYYVVIHFYVSFPVRSQEVKWWGGCVYIIWISVNILSSVQGFKRAVTERKCTVVFDDVLFVV